MFKQLSTKTDVRMNLVDHLAELRRRIIISGLSLIIGVVLGFYFAESILQKLLELPGDLVYLYPGEAFFAYLKIALIMGIVLALPIILYQLLAFIVPGLEPKERKALLTGIPFAILLFAGGSFFAYRFLMPIAYLFFMGFATEGLKPMISIGSYLSFVLGVVLPTGLVFQLPLVVILLTSVGILQPTFLASNRKFVILAVFIMAAFLTPPDVVSQTLLAVSMLLLYEISIVLSKVMYNRRQQRLGAEN